MAKANLTETTGSSITTNTSSITYSHTNTGSFLVVCVGGQDNSNSTVTGITYNGVSLTQVVNTTAREGASGTYRHSAIFYLISPAQGAYNVVVSYGTTITTCASRAFSFTNVANVTPVDTSGQDAPTTQKNSGSISLTSSEKDYLFVDSIEVDNSSISAPSSPTRTNYYLISDGGNSETMGFSYKTDVTKGTVAYIFPTDGGNRYLCYTGAIFKTVDFGGSFLYNLL